jgi:Xaa-Pro dipeptidase
MMCRYYSGRRRLSANDQLTLEFAGVYRHYHSALMRTIAIGKLPARQRELWAAAIDALQASEAAACPGQTFGGIFAAHARALDNKGLGMYRLNACGYSLGSTYAPSWMDWPMVYEANPTPIRPGMVVFLHMIIFDDETGLAATLGRTSLITETGAEPLSTAALDLVINH